MFSKLEKRSTLKHCFRKKDFARHGLTAEYVGAQTIKIRRDGSYLGQLRQSIGTYRWYPAGSNQPEFREFSPEKVLVRIVESLQPQARGPSGHFVAGFR
jgi:hypothetical protein